MTRCHGILPGLFFLTVFSVIFLVPPESRAAQSCAQMVEKVKERTGPVHAPMPHMGTASRYVAAAEEALAKGDEARCLEELGKTEKWLRMNRSRRGDR
jgi:hypothetical protein